MDLDLIAYFWRNLEMRGPDECWIWKGGKSEKGRGTIFWEGKILQATRVSWEIHHGTPPGNLQVLHKCDMSLCCNCRHFFLGTQKQNMEDMVRKKRNVSFAGACHPRVKLSEESVHIIRQIPKGTKGLAKRFGVTTAQICSIRNGKSWKSLI